MTEIRQTAIEFCTQCQVPLHHGCANHCLECETILCDKCYGDNNYLCERCNPPVQNFKTIRRSHIELFNTCPYALYLILVKGVEPPSNEYAQVGTLVHQVIDMISNGLYTYEQGQAEVVSEIQKRFHEHEKFETFKQTGAKSIEGFSKIMYDLGKDFLVEENIIFSLGDDLPQISCTLDRIDFVDDEIHIADWKTGKPMSGQKLITDLQAPLYIEAVHNRFDKYPKTFTFYYLANDKMKIYERTIENGKVYYDVKSGRTSYRLDMEEALHRTKDILTKINNKQFNMPTEVHQYYCQNMCWFYKSGICASSSKEQWKVLKEKYTE